jgi:hypothetical protein
MKWKKGVEGSPGGKQEGVLFMKPEIFLDVTSAKP